jgi:hypothetical protein
VVFSVASVSSIRKERISVMPSIPNASPKARTRRIRTSHFSVASDSFREELEGVSEDRDEREEEGGGVPTIRLVDRYETGSDYATHTAGSDT